MSWTIAGKYVRASATDPDAQAYLQAVEAADGQALEFEVARAIDNFVLGCKSDGIWNAIKASCILAGARTRLGALTPLVGTAPTSFNFVDGDYNRKTGLVGNGSTKYLDSNRNNNADPQDNNHNSFYLTTLPLGVHRTMGAAVLGGSVQAGGNLLSGNGAGMLARNRSASASSLTEPAAINSLVGASRSSSLSFIARAGYANQSVNISSETPYSSSVSIFRDDAIYSDARLAFYSIGESLDLALLDARVTDLINAFDTAIPS
jgi:hypothetical protein